MKQRFEILVHRFDLVLLSNNLDASGRGMWDIEDLVRPKLQPKLSASK